jgi:hypothetical protein
MANGTTYGLSFPFNDSIRGDYLELTQFQKDEIKSDFIVKHLYTGMKGLLQFSQIKNGN